MCISFLECLLKYQIQDIKIYFFLKFVYTEYGQTHLEMSYLVVCCCFFSPRKLCCDYWFITKALCFLKGIPEISLGVGYFVFLGVTYNQYCQDNGGKMLEMFYIFFNFLILFCCLFNMSFLVFLKRELDLKEYNLVKSAEI